MKLRVFRLHVMASDIALQYYDGSINTDASQLIAGRKAEGIAQVGAQSRNTNKDRYGSLRTRRAF